MKEGLEVTGEKILFEMARRAVFALKNEEIGKEPHIPYVHINTSPVRRAHGRQGGISAGENPNGLEVKLHKYQLEAVAWMAKLEREVTARMSPSLVSE